MGWIEDKKLKAHVIADRLSPLGKAAKLYSWTFGGPLLWKAAQLGYGGVIKGMDKLRWTGHTALEAGKGAAQMMLKPLADVAYSRLVTVKHFLWDVPLATFSAALRLPIGLAKAPLEMARGVRDAIKSIPKNAREVYKAVTDLRFMDTIRSTRDGVLDILLPPFTKPITPIISPFGDVGEAAWEAETQAWGAIKTGIKETIPAGMERIKNAPNTATGIMAQTQAAREVRNAQKEALSKAKKDQMQAMVDKERGFTPPRLDENGQVVEGSS